MWLDWHQERFLVEDNDSWSKTMVLGRRQWFLVEIGKLGPYAMCIISTLPALYIVAFCVALLYRQIAVPGLFFYYINAI